MAYNQNVNDYFNQQLLFSNQSPATTGDIYAAISTILSGMNLPNTTDIANQVYSIIQPELAQCLNRADQSRINMEQHIEMLIRQHWAQVMQNEKLRKVKRSSVRRYTRNEAGFGLCMEAGKQDVKVGYIEIQKTLDLRIGKNGTYYDYKYVVYLDSKKEYRNVMIPLEKLSSKKLLSLFRGFEYVCNNSTIANEYLAWCINTFPNPNNFAIPEYPGFSIMTENEKEYAVFYCNDNNVDIKILEECSDSFKSKIMPDGSLNVDEIKSYIKAYLGTAEKIILFAYSICGLLSTVLHDISYPIKQILSIASPNDDFTRQAGYYLQTYNKNKSILSFDNNIRAIEKTFHNAKDETVVIKDCIYVDNDKRRRDVMNKILVWDSDKQTKPHNTAVISAGAQYIIHNNQKICMTLSDDFYTWMTYEEEENMCRALSLLTRCIINVICKNYENFKQELKDNIDNAMETDKAQELPFIHSMISYSVIISVIEMLGKYLNIPINNMEISEYLLEMFRISTNVTDDSNDAIADEFIKKLNAKIRNDEISIIMHKKDMEFIKGEPQIIIKDNLILMEESTLNEVFLPDMSTTESVFHILESLNMTDLLHATKKLRYPCTVYYKGIPSIESFIAVKLHEVLDLDVQFKIQAKACEEWFSADNSEPNMIPIITNQINYKACHKYDFEEIDNMHCFVTGESGSGKTHFLTEYAVTLHNAGQTVIIFDTSDSFTEKSVVRNLSVKGDEATKEKVKKYVEENFIFHNVEKDGIPVDILKLDHQVSSIDKKKIVNSIISASIQNMGKRQRAELCRCIEKLMEDNRLSMIDLYEEIIEGNVSDSLSMQFEDILSVFLEYKISEKSWGEFLRENNGIIIISSTALSGAGGSALVDMLLMSLLCYQKKHSDKHISVVIDEIQKQNCGANSAIIQGITEGRKYQISLIYATQHLAETNRERTKAMSGAGIKVYFRPDNISAKSIARSIDVHAGELTSMKIGECYVKGTLYNNSEHSNRIGTVHGFTYRNFVTETD